VAPFPIIIAISVLRATIGPGPPVRPPNRDNPDQPRHLPRRMTRFRLRPWIVAPSQSERTCQQLQPSFGVYPVHVPEEGILSEPYPRRQFAAQWLRDHALDEGLVLLVESSGTLKAEDTKRLDIIALGK
jgi:pyruvate kinase